MLEDIEPQSPEKIPTVEDDDIEDLLEIELDEKLIKFKGKIDDVNEDTGKLLVDEDKEDVHVTSSTYKKVITMAGGLPFLVLLLLAQLFCDVCDA